MTNNKILSTHYTVRIIISVEELQVLTLKNFENKHLTTQYEISKGQMEQGKLFTVTDTSFINFLLTTNPENVMEGLPGWHVNIDDEDKQEGVCGVQGLHQGRVDLT